MTVLYEGRERECVVVQVSQPKFLNPFPHTATEVEVATCNVVDPKYIPRCIYGRFFDVHDNGLRCRIKS